MRQKRANSFFTFLYPGREPNSGQPPKSSPQIAIPFSGEFVSICGQEYGGEQPSAVFYEPQQLRDLAECLNEAADLWEQYRANGKPKRFTWEIKSFGGVLPKKDEG